ncbi:ccr4 associated factor [Amphichorda felina]
MRPFTKRALAHGAPSNPVCHGCRLQRRAFANSSSPPKPPSSGIAPLPSRQLLSIAGPDAAKFLQGIVTANVVSQDGRARPDGCYAAFLNATGRIMNDVFIYPGRAGFAGGEDGTSFLIEADTNQMDFLTRFIKRYKLRAKVNVRKIQPDEVTVWQAWTDGPSSNLDLPSSDSTVLLRDPRTPDLGYRILQLGDKTPAVDLDQTSEDSYTIRRYLRGVPEGQDEILREQALPQESNMDFMNGIDFHKGCYVGQELTIRTRHRGVVRKRVLPCVIYDKQHAPPQALHYDPNGATADPASTERLTADMIPQEASIGRFERRGRSAGKWLRGVGNVGLGLCRLEIMTGVTLPGETAAATFDPSHEFVLEWGEEEARSGVKVKAFVPDWIQAGLDASRR